MIGDNLVDRSLDLCREAFKLISYDPLQGTHPALGTVDHVSSRLIMDEILPVIIMIVPRGCKTHRANKNILHANIENFVESCQSIVWCMPRDVETSWKHWYDNLEYCTTYIECQSDIRISSKIKESIASTMHNSEGKENITTIVLLIIWFAI